MPMKYTRIVPVLGSLLAVTLIAGQAFAQDSRPPLTQPAAPSAQQPPAREPAPAKPQAQIARGELTNIDATAKMLTIKPTEGAEQKFMYNDETKVTGARGGVAGLATQGGKQVVVHFNAQGANRVATEIEVQAGEK